MTEGGDTAIAEGAVSAGRTKTVLWCVFGGLAVLVLLPEVIPIGAVCGLIFGVRRLWRLVRPGDEETCTRPVAAD